jgi:hypothetical protein
VSSFKTSITKSGPFFTKDPLKTFDQNATAMMEGVAKAAEDDIRGQLRAGQSGRWPLSGGLRPHRVADHVHGRVVSVDGKRWHRWAAVSILEPGASRSDAVALAAAGSWLESTTHAFRKTKGRVSRARVVNTDLLKGL